LHGNVAGNASYFLYQRELSYCYYPQLKVSTQLYDDAHLCHSERSEESLAIRSKDFLGRTESTRSDIHKFLKSSNPCMIKFMLILIVYPVNLKTPIPTPHS